jgi:uncharacterized protein (TIGR02266 family)
MNMGEDMDYTDLLEAFLSLDHARCNDPESLTPSEMKRWHQLRVDIENALRKGVPEGVQNTREHLRVPVSMAARCKMEQDLWDRRISELGEGGLFVATDDPLPVGSFVDLEIVVADSGKTLDIKGEVVWTCKEQDAARTGMGIKFVGLTPKQRDAVQQLVYDRLQEALAGLN